MVVRALPAAHYIQYCTVGTWGAIRRRRTITFLSLLLHRGSFPRRFASSGGDQCSGLVDGLYDAQKQPRPGQCSLAAAAGAGCYLNGPRLAGRGDPIELAVAIGK